SQSSYMLTEARSDNTFQGQAYDDGPITRFEVRPDLPVLSSTWTAYYNNINRCNRILESLGNVELSDVKRSQYEGEARFGRALFYFDLVRLWGGVPMVTSTLSIDESYNRLRSSTEEIYDLIVSDLIAAAELLPEDYSDADFGRATKWAAKGFLGKVYLFRSGYPLNNNEWELARQSFQGVINPSQFSFFENYEDIYSYDHAAGRQQVFSIR